MVQIHPRAPAGFYGIAGLLGCWVAIKSVIPENFGVKQRNLSEIHIQLKIRSTKSECSKQCSNDQNSNDQNLF